MILLTGASKAPLAAGRLRQDRNMAHLGNPAHIRCKNLEVTLTCGEPSGSMRECDDGRLQKTAIGIVNHSKRVRHDMACLEDGGARCEPVVNGLLRSIGGHHGLHT